MSEKDEIALKLEDGPRSLYIASMFNSIYMSTGFLSIEILYWAKSIMRASRQKLKEKNAQVVDKLHILVTVTFKIFLCIYLQVKFLHFKYMQSKLLETVLNTDFMEWKLCLCYAEGQIKLLSWSCQALNSVFMKIFL